MAETGVRLGVILRSAVRTEKATALVDDLLRWTLAAKEARARHPR